MNISSTKTVKYIWKYSFSKFKASFGYTLKTILGDHLALIPFIAVVATHYLHNYLFSQCEDLINIFNTESYLNQLAISHPNLPVNELENILYTHLFKWLFTQPAFWKNYLSIMIPTILCSIISLAFWIANIVSTHLSSHGWQVVKKARIKFTSTFIVILFAIILFEELFISTDGVFGHIKPAAYIISLWLSIELLKPTSFKTIRSFGIVLIRNIVGKYILLNVLFVFLALWHSIPLFMMKCGEILYFMFVYQLLNKEIRQPINALFEFGYPVIIAFLVVKFIGAYSHSFLSIYYDKWNDENSITGNVVK